MNMNFLSKLANPKASRMILQAQKHSPEILLGVGIAGFIATAIVASRATLKVQSIKDEAAEKKKQVEFGKENLESDVYSKKDYENDLLIIKINTFTEYAKLYAPAIGLGVFSTSCILASHGIMSRRNAALMGAFKLLQDSYEDYRKRVREEVGDEKEKEIFFGIKKKPTTAEEVLGKKKKGAKEDDGEFMIDGVNYSIYAKFFDESNPNWTTNPLLNLFYLKSQQNYANDMLKIKGHIFLNEVYDLLQMPRTSEGALVGWVYDSENGDSVVDFGIYNPNSDSARRFVNGEETNILLDFNVDGVIYDLI